MLIEICYDLPLWQFNHDIVVTILIDVVMKFSRIQSSGDAKILISWELKCILNYIVKLWIFKIGEYKTTFVYKVK